MTTVSSHRVCPYWALALAVGLWAVPSFAAVTMTLAGEWACRLDRESVGREQGWFKQDVGSTVRLPGSLDENDLGDVDAGNNAYNRLSRKRTYTGPVWYQRMVEIPASWAGMNIVLFLERCHWQTTIWVDDLEAGTRDSLCVPHEYDLSRLLSPGPHRLTLCVDNTPKHFLGGFASSISEETQTNWNGIIGRIELCARAPVWIENVHVYPAVGRRDVEVRLTLGNRTGASLDGELMVQAEVGDGVAPVLGRFNYRAGEERTQLSVRLPLGDHVRLWNEFSPALYRLTVTLSGTRAGTVYTDEYETVFGMRELAVENKRLVLNGDAVFLRGTLECCVFPLTGYPPTDEAAWAHILGICRSYGLNHMRFHSWCPPEAAFTAADKAGFFLQVEAPRANVGTDEALDQYIEAEAVRIVDTYGNHPSFVMMSMGNELAVSENVLMSLLAILKEHDPRHLYTASTGTGPQTSEDEFRVRAEGRGIWGPSTERDLRTEVDRAPLPLVMHEIGQWAVYPALTEVDKYTGVLEPRNVAMIRDDLEAKHMLDQAAAFTRATGKHSALLYKEEIEVLLRTPGLAGFQLLGLHDYPGTGTALVGLLDVFWDSKGVIAPGEFRQFCGETVPLLRMGKREYVSDERFTATAQIIHYGRTAIDGAEPVWRLEDDAGRIVAEGLFPTVSIPRGGHVDLGAIDADLTSVLRATKVRVSIALRGTQVVNGWDIWVYPAGIDSAVPDGIVTSNQSDDTTIAALQDGRRVLMLPPLRHLRKALRGRFLPVFWSPVWFASANVSMSILCDPAHPALADFPTESHSNWQWWDLLQNASLMVMDALPADVRPIVQVIDNFTRNQRLAVLFEARVGNGRLLVCSVNIEKNLDTRPAARQLRSSLLAYMASPAFNPVSALSADQVSLLFRELLAPVLSTGKARVIRADSQDAASGNVAARAIDGNPETFWCTQWVGEEPPFPHEIVIDMGREIRLAGFSLLPRQDGNSNGWFERGEFYVSNDMGSWGEPVIQAQLPATIDEKRVILPEPCAGRYIRLVAMDGISGKPWAAIAELDVIPAE